MMLVAVLVVVVPGGLLVWLRTQTNDQLSGLEPEPTPVVAPVEVREISDAKGVTVIPVWGEVPVMVAPTWSGTVSAVRVASGDVVVSGDRVVRVDGVDRVAIATAEPFWRHLRRSDSGLDVSALEEWLTTAGYYDGEIDGSFGGGLSAAVRAWAATLGVRSPDGSFDPGWVVWLPSDRFAVSAVEIAPGLLAPGAGTPMLSSATPLLSVELRDQNGHVLAEDGRWLMSVEGVMLPVVDSQVTDDGMALLQTALDPAEQAATGRIRREVPVAALEVPATAIVTNRSGATCVFIPTGDGGFEARSVTLGSGQISRVGVVDGLDAGDEVLVNPPDIFDTPACP